MVYSWLNQSGHVSDGWHSEGTQWPQSRRDNVCLSASAAIESSTSASAPGRVIFRILSQAENFGSVNSPNIGALGVLA